MSAHAYPSVPITVAAKRLTYTRTTFPTKAAARLSRCGDATECENRPKLRGPASCREIVSFSTAGSGTASIQRLESTEGSTSLYPHNARPARDRQCRQSPEAAKRQAEKCSQKGVKNGGPCVVTEDEDTQVTLAAPLEVGNGLVDLEEPSLLARSRRKPSRPRRGREPRAPRRPVRSRNRQARRSSRPSAWPE